jgi:hypothetical protein
MSVVTSFQDHKRSKRPFSDEVELRRLAVQIVVMLPPDGAEALEVLDHAKTLVSTFLMESQAPAN